MKRKRSKRTTNQVEAHRDSSGRIIRRSDKVRNRAGHTLWVADMESGVLTCRNWSANGATVRVAADSVTVI